MKDIREYFREVVEEAANIRPRRILFSCAIPWDWFNGKKPRKAYLLSEIDVMEEAELETALAIFIALCFRQR